MDQNTTLQKPNEITRNPIGLPTIASNEVCELLDKLASSFAAQTHIYLKHHWLVEGPEHRDLHIFFEESYHDSLKHLDAIAERMTVLGAIPTASMTAQAAKSILLEEVEGRLPIREMLKADLQNEMSLIDFIRESVNTASSLSDYGTETLLKRILMEREERSHEIEHYLSKDSVQNNPLQDALL